MQTRIQLLLAATCLLFSCCRGATTSRNQAVSGVRSSRKPNHNPITVYTTQSQTTTMSSRAVTLGCYYELETLEDNPVTIVWLVGDGPRKSSPIFKCTGFTYGEGSCRHQVVTDSRYENRLSLRNHTADLHISEVKAADNRIYWCRVSIDDSNELGFDMRSVGLRVIDAVESTPKLHTVDVGQLNVSSQQTGGQLNLVCSCRGSHCDDVYWYKGPTSRLEDVTEFNLVYTRMTRSRPLPTLYQSHGSWVNRTYLEGFTLTITDLRVSDAGRYWCEIRASDFYQIGEFGTDARSQIIHVTDNDDDFSCAGKSDGVYAHPSDCELYYECFAGRAYHRLCPPGTVFNPAGGTYFTCDHARNVPPPCGHRN